MAVYNGLSISRKLSDIQDKAAALNNLNLSLRDLDVIRGVSSTLVADDIKTLSGLDFDFERYVTSLNYETGIYDVLITNAYDESAYINSDIFVNGQFGAASIKYNFYDTDTKGIVSADISTSRVSSWSSFTTPPTISSPIFYGGEVKVEGPIEFTELLINSTVEPKRFNTEIPTHKIRVRIDGVETWLYAMKGIPLIFRGFFRNLLTTNAAIGITQYNTSIRPSWVVQIVDTGRESVISPALTTIGGVRTSRPTVRDTIAREKDIKFYFAPDFITTITMVTLGLTEFPQVILPNLTTLNVQSNDLRLMPDLSRYNSLINFNIFSNNLSRANPPAALLDIDGTIANFSGNISTTSVITTITDLESTAGFVPGMTLTKTGGSGAFGGTTKIFSVDSGTQITIQSTSVNTVGSISFSTPTLARITDILGTNDLQVGMLLTKTGGVGAFGDTSYIASITNSTTVIFRSEVANTLGSINFSGRLELSTLSQTITSRLPAKIENIQMGNTYSGALTGDFSNFYKLASLNIDAVSESNRRLTGTSPKVWLDTVNNGTADALKTYNVNVNLFTALDQSVMDCKSLENLNIRFNRISNDITIASANLKTFVTGGSGNVHPIVDVSGKLFLTSYTHSTTSVGAFVSLSGVLGTITNVVNTGIVNNIPVNSYTATITVTDTTGIFEQQVVIVTAGPGAVGANTVITSVGVTSITIRSATAITEGDITFTTYRTVTNIFNGCLLLSTINLSENAGAYGPVPSLQGCNALVSISMVSTNVFDAVPGQFVLDSTTLADCKNTLKSYTLTSSQFSLNAQFHPDCFQDMAVLDYVQIISNKRGISGPLPSFTTAPNIRYILLYNNNLTGTIDTYDANNKLFYLHLYNNSLSGSVPNILQPTLQHLLLSYNLLTTFNQIDSINLRRLHLSFNRLSNIPDMSKLTFLQEFLFNNQNLRAVNKTTVTYTPGAFVGLTAIKTLNLSNNSITQSGINNIIRDLGANYAANPRTGVSINLTGNKPPLLTSEIVLILTNLAAGGWNVQTS